MCVFAPYHNSTSSDKGKSVDRVCGKQVLI